MSARMSAYALIATLVAAVSLHGAEQSHAAKPKAEVSGGPYCGVYCVYSALNSFGIGADFERLLEPKYVGSERGSTIGELRRAIVDFGGHALPMEGLTASTLRSSSNPIILHVRRPGLNIPYAHWVLFMGMDGDQARIVDPPNSVQLLSLAELLALWDGTGIVVSPRPIHGALMRAAAYVQQAIVLLSLIVVALTIRAFLKHRPLYVFAALLATAVGAAMLYHMVDDEGLLRNRVAVAEVVGMHFKAKLDIVSTDEVGESIEHSDVAIIDARFPTDYANGHLPGAVNLPVYSGLAERRDVLAGVDPKQRVVVYCQSDHCEWGEIIAADLKFRGYDNVAVYRGGYREWVEHERGRNKR